MAGFDKDVRIPAYQRHKASGKAVVKLNGRVHYLGKHGTDESRDAYNRLIAEWLSTGKNLPPRGEAERKTLRVDDVVAMFWTWAEGYYVKDGAPTGELDSLRLAIKPLLRLYRSEFAEKFGPLALRAVQDEYVRLGWARTTVNQSMARVRRIFKWAVSRELVPAGTHHGLQAVTGLRRGRSEAKETEPIGPVLEKDMHAVLPHVSRQVEAMIWLQWLTGMRPGEVVQMRAKDLDRSGAIWLYRPGHHKTEHHGIVREIAVGPHAQDILKPFLTLDPDRPLFSPQDAEEERNRERRAARKTPLWPSHAKRRRVRKHRADLRDTYDVQGYGRAIEYGIRCANAAMIRDAVADAVLPLLPEPVREPLGAAFKKLRHDATSETVLAVVQEVMRICDHVTLPGSISTVEEAAEAAIKALRLVPSWRPNQLRHAAATRIRKQFGIEAARAVLGHQNVATTEIYAEADRVKSLEIAKVLG